jgi:RNA polymerase sigma-70 factor (ECF subfamily)
MPGFDDAGRPRPAFDQVFREFEPALRRVALGYAADSAEAEDLFQEICYAIWRALPRFRGDAAMKTFVWRIAHNRGLTHRARQARLPTHEGELDAVADPAPSVEQRLGEELRDERLLAAVRRLSDAQREVILLSLEGLTQAEIGEVLGVTENTVAVRLNRARNALRARLDPRSFDR